MENADIRSNDKIGGERMNPRMKTLILLLIMGILLTTQTVSARNLYPSYGTTDSNGEIILVYNTPYTGQHPVVGGAVPWVLWLCGEHRDPNTWEWQQYRTSQSSLMIPTRYAWNRYGNMMNIYVVVN